MEKTAEEYSRKVDEHWKEFTAPQPARRSSYFYRYYPWIMLHRNFYNDSGTYLRGISGRGAETAAAGAAAGGSAEGLSGRDPMQFFNTVGGGEGAPISVPM